jgi:hypothetical protein
MAAPSFLFDRTTRRATSLGADFQRFDGGIDEIMSGIQAQVEGEFRRLLVSIGDHLIAYMPVDTGRARSNVIASTGGFSSDVYWDTALPQINPEGSTARQQIREVARRWTLDQGNLYLVNNIYYVGLLNSSKPSPQAAPGFIENAVAAGVQDAPSYINEIP